MNKLFKNVNASEDYLVAMSQGDLTGGIPKQAQQDLRRFYGATSTVERELYLDAYRWFTVNDSSWPFSFVNVCELLNRASEVLREELLGDLSLSFFSYWTRRCGRAARQSHTFLSGALTNERNPNAAEPASLAQAVF